MEKQEKLTNAQLEQVLMENRKRYSAKGTPEKIAVSETEALARPDLL